MATLTTNLIRYSKDLSYKLGDVTALGTEDGEIYSAELRLKYLSRAYGRMKRTLNAIFPQTISKIFPDFYKVAEETAILNNAIALDTADIYNIHDIYVKRDSDSAVGDTWLSYQANYILPENYFRVKYNDSTDYYIPSETDGRFYYTVIDGNIKFLPESTTYTWYADLFYQNNMLHDSYEGTLDIRIPYEYADLLLTLAAQEAMYDTGDTRALNKAQVYGGDIQRQLSILINKAQMEDIKEDNRTV